MTPSFAPGLAAAVFATAAWGLQMPIAHDAFTIVDPFHITAARYFIAALFLLPILLWREGWAALNLKDRGMTAAVLGVVGMCGSPMLVFFGMSMSTAEHAVVIVTLQPALAAIAIWVFGGQRPARFTLACIAVAFLGVVAVVTRGEPLSVTSNRQLLGDAIVVVGSACWVAYTLGLSRLHGWSTWRITVLTMFPGACATGAMTLVLLQLGYLVTPSFSAVQEVCWELAYLTFIGVLIAMLAWNYGARHIGGLNATLLINLMPVTTFLYRAAQGHQFVRMEVAGAALVVGALVANNFYLRRRQHEIRDLEAL